MYLAWTRRHTMRARQLATMASMIAAALARESDPAPLKYVLSTMRLMSPRLRLPLVEPMSETKAAIDAVLARVSEMYPGYLNGDIRRARFSGDTAHFGTASAEATHCW
jgi:dihydrodipicolinate synthase/N-acetylneuraminate lyase